MNKNEATLLFEKSEIKTQPGQSIFITDGESGALHYGSGSTPEHIRAVPAVELDPTGAGDTFCGATLAGLACGLDAIKAAQLGARLATQVIEKPGSNFYF